MPPPDPKAKWQGSQNPCHFALGSAVFRPARPRDCSPKTPVVGAKRQDCLTPSRTGKQQILQQSGKAPKTLATLLWDLLFPVRRGRAVLGTLPLCTWNCCFPVGAAREACLCGPCRPPVRTSSREGLNIYLAQRARTTFRHVCKRTASGGNPLAAVVLRYPAAAGLRATEHR